MKAKEVLKFLNITRQTLCKYVKTKMILVNKLPNGDYDYNEDSVFKFKNSKLERKNVLYCRVSTPKQKKELENQKELLETFCNKNGILINDIFSEIGSGINLDRKEFKRLINEIVDYKISKIFITYKDRLSRLSFSLFEELFQKFGTKIIVLNEIEDSKNVEKEVLNEIISLIHCFSMKVYSNRRKEKLKLISKDLELENDNS